MRVQIPLLAILLATSTGLLATPTGANASGLLELQSQPGVTVTWEGVVLGKTDAEGSMVIEGIPPGQYRLNLSKSGFQTFEVAIDVAAGSRSSPRWLLEPIRPSHERRSTESSVESMPEPSVEPPGQSPPKGREPMAPRGEAPRGPTAKQDVEPEAESGSQLEPSTEVRGEIQPLVDTQPQADATAEAPALDASDAGRATAPTPAGAPTSVSPFLAGLAVLAALLLGAVGARRFSSRPAAAEPAIRSDPEPPAPADEDLPVFEELESEPQKFLEDLKRREQRLEDRPVPTAPPDETIIEVEAIEVRPADES